MTEVPWEMLRKEMPGIDVPAGKNGKTGVGMVFLPQDPIQVHKLALSIVALTHWCR